MTVITERPAALDADRAELLRALGAVVLSPPPSSDLICEALGLEPIGGAEHTAAFVLLSPPHAAIHLGEEGKLGGEAADRVDGFWRALRIPPPHDADHLGCLLLGYASLRENEAPHARHAARALLREHLWSWAPGYLSSLHHTSSGGVATWAELTLETLCDEMRALGAGDELPLALREAPPAIAADLGRDELLDTLVAPLRSGIVLTQRDIATAAGTLGVGMRRGERRFALKAMFEQDARATLEWLEATATRWSIRHRSAYDDTATGSWWAARADATASALAELRMENS